MTGADHFARLLHQAEMVALGAPERHRAVVTMNILQGGALGLAARLFNDNDFAGGHDVVLLATQAIVQLAPEMAKDPDIADGMQRMFARMQGADVPLMDRPVPAPVLAPGNALSAEEMAELGLEPEPVTLADVIGAKMAAASVEPMETFAQRANREAFSLHYRWRAKQCIHRKNDGCRRTPAIVRVALARDGSLHVAGVCQHHADYEQGELVEYEGLFWHAEGSGDFFGETPESPPRTQEDSEL